MVVNDPARVDRFKDKEGSSWLAELIDDTKEVVNTLATYYQDTDFGEFVGEVQIVLSVVVNFHNWTSVGTEYRPQALINAKNEDGGSACAEDTPSDYCGGCTGSSYCEASYQSYLTKFHNWRRSDDAPDHDNGQLLSRYDFYDSVIGYASLPGMCITSSSGGINQATYDEEYNGNIVAHEMGHNFDMSHDGTGNSCNQEKFIMASVGSPNGYRPDAFSDCSVSYMDDFFNDYKSTLTCLDNVPYETQYAICGNGFVEEGESCDCGDDTCTHDSCCDGELCQLFGDADCSNNDICCSDCKVREASEEYECRAKSDDSCDVGAETCDGTQSACPSDTHLIEGERCKAPASASATEGYCYNKQCISIENQCNVQGDLFGGSPPYTRCDDYGNLTFPWKAQGSKCNNKLNCKNSGGTCDDVDSSIEYEDGTPCYDGTWPGAATQCHKGTCKQSTEIYTYKWHASAWDPCTLSCVDDSNGIVGTQNRTVRCTLQNNTPANESKCDADTKPISFRRCNNFVCDFCRPQSDGFDQCHPNGDCISEGAGRCDCDYGFGGDNCEIFPMLEWIGITRRVYDAADGTTIAERADPMGLINATTELNTETVPVTGVWSLTNLTVGDTLALRWNSSGDLQFLAVGLWDRDESHWVNYVGAGLAVDKQDCDATDPFLLDVSCDDFSFTIPDDTIPGTYQIIVRFNNAFTVYSEIVTIACTDRYCNHTGHGQCASDGTCQCFDNWYGDSCGNYRCSEWAFATGDAYTAAITFPQCINLNDSYCDATATSIDDRCDCDGHFQGEFCEVPVDGCGSLSAGQCVLDPLCEYHDPSTSCIYKSCSVYDNTECGRAYADRPDKNITGQDVPATWDCEWEPTKSVCVKRFCGGIGSCENNALMRPIVDYTSICDTDNWYCDCTTIPGSEDAYWETRTKSELSSASDDVKSCAECTLDCENGASASDDCTTCDGCKGKFGGLLCNYRYWIISTKVNIDYDTAWGFRREEFEEKYLQDFAYVLGVPRRRMEIWQMKKDGGSSCIAYFKYIFQESNKDEIQKIGGDLFVDLQSMAADEDSPVYRGWLTNYTAPGHELKWCLPYREECDPEDQFDFIFWFLLCFGISFGFQILMVLLYRLVTRKKRRRRYEEKVKRVREAQQNLVAMRGKARRVGMRDVSKSRAKHIHKEQEKRRKSEIAEIKERQRRESQIKKRESKKKRQDSADQAAMDARMSQIAEEPQFGDDFADDFGGGDAHQGGFLDPAQQDPRASARGSVRPSGFMAAHAQDFNAMHEGPGGGGGGGHGHGEGVGGGEAFDEAEDLPGFQNEEPGGHAPGFNPNVLPENWEVYYNDDGIPYYYNNVTGETSWRHPLDQGWQ